MYLHNVSCCIMSFFLVLDKKNISEFMLTSFFYQWILRQMRLMVSLWMQMRPYSVTMHKINSRLYMPSLNSLLFEKVVYACAQNVSPWTRSVSKTCACATAGQMHHLVQLIHASKMLSPNSLTSRILLRAFKWKRLAL